MEKMSRKEKYSHIKIKPQSGFWCYNCDVQDGTIAIKLNTFQAIHLCPQCFRWLQEEMASYNGLEVVQNDA